MNEREQLVGSRPDTPMKVILVVLAVLAVGFGLFMVARSRSDPHGFPVEVSQKVKTDVLWIALACEDYAARNDGRFPADLAELLRPDEQGFTWLNVTAVPRDPWGREYQYASPTSAHVAPRVWSWGRDGVEGGTLADQDYGSWMIPSDPEDG